MEWTNLDGFRLRWAKLSFLVSFMVIILTVVLIAWVIFRQVSHEVSFVGGYGYSPYIRVFPDWNVHLSFIAGALNSAMAADARLSSHPIEVPCPDANMVNQVCCAPTCPINCSRSRLS